VIVMTTTPQEPADPDVVPSGDPATDPIPDPDTEPSPEPAPDPDLPGPPDRGPGGGEPVVPA